MAGRTQGSGIAKVKRDDPERMTHQGRRIEVHQIGLGPTRDALIKKRKIAR
jgi:hypothetical protein